MLTKNAVLYSSGVLWMFVQSGFGNNSSLITDVDVSTKSRFDWISTGYF